MATREPLRCATIVPRIIVDGLWANPPFALVQRICQEARRSVPSHGRVHDSDMVARRPWLRKVSAAFHGRLRRAGIYVEGGG